VVVIALWICRRVLIELMAGWIECRVDVRRVAVKRWRPPWTVARSGDENATGGSGVSEFWFWLWTLCRRGRRTGRRICHEKQLTRVPSECMSDNTSSATASCTVSSVLLAVRGGRFVDLILLYTLPSTAVLFMTHCELAEINKKG
jgi:hypothetical protein